MAEDCVISITERLAKIGPKGADHCSVGEDCPACDQPFKAGDYTTWVALGPGPDAKQRRLARTGRPFRAVAIEVHFSCATGFEN